MSMMSYRQESQLNSTLRARINLSYWEGSKQAYQYIIHRMYITISGDRVASLWH
jgi:hypothetical protein